MSAPKKNNKLRRGGSAHYRELQKKSLESRITRNIEVEVCRSGNRNVVTIPGRRRATDAGYDLSSAEKVIIRPGKRVMIPTGVKVCSPTGYAYFITGRSSLNRLGIEHPLGVIDAGYTGELFVTLVNNSNKVYTIKPGDRIAQLVFFPIIHAKMKEVESFSEEKARGDLGWGSSGK